MKIHCCSCHKVLNDNDVVVISIINGISHYTCVLIPSDLIEEVGTYQYIKQKYDFFS